MIKAVTFAVVATLAMCQASSEKQSAEKILAKAKADNKDEPVLAELGAQWRFGSNYVPQHYGNWQFVDGRWNFGNDKRIECESCGYVMYMLIDRLGDQFNRMDVIEEMKHLCPRVQWVFRSACEHVLSKYAEPVVKMVMRLTEPEDICKQVGLCSPDFYDVAMMGGAAGAAAHPGFKHPGSFMGANPAGGVGAGMAMGHPNLGYAQPDGSGYGMYPAPGMRPVTAASPYSPYSFGGYDGAGFPMPHPGVPSSTPPPPSEIPAPGAAPAPAA